MKAIIPILTLLLASCTSDPSPFGTRSDAEQNDSASDGGITLTIESTDLEDDVMEIGH